MDPEAISAALAAKADADTARRLGREVHTLKGVRGVPPAEVARCAAATYRAGGVDLDRDEDAITALFSVAFEDGLVAIALLAAAAPDQPAAALDVGLELLRRVDDHQSADALGWLVLGPARLLTGAPLSTLIAAAKERGHPAPRRAVVATGLSLTPEIVQSPAASALRERRGARALRFVDAPRSAELHELLTAFVRDDAPPVRKIVRRVIGAWALVDPDAAEAWGDGVRGGLPKMLREELVRAARKGRRKAGGA